MKPTGSSREEVKQRLLRTAAEVWGMPGLRTGQVDPLVGLLFGAMALEIERIGHAIHDSDARVFERIARYLLPEVLTLADPAHAVVKLHPAGAMTATRYEEMTFERTLRRKENMNRPETQEFCFSMAGDVPLDGLRCVCRVVVDEIAIMDGIRWTMAGRPSVAAGPQTMYLGLSGTFVNGGILRLYFDWPGHAGRDRCLAAIPRITAYDMTGTALPTAIGLTREDALPEHGQETGITAMLEKRVRAFHNNHFLRIKVGHLSEAVPTNLREAAEQVGVPEPTHLRWLRLDLPSDITPDMMRDALVLDNCAPVVNRRLERAIYRLQHELNIKRLDANGAFLGMEKAESSRGATYVEVPSAEQVDITPGSFTIRHGATARFDERDGSELLQHTVDQIREESRAFASMDMASTASDLRAVGQALSRIEKRLQAAVSGKAQTYLAMRPFDNTETAHLHYWTSDGEAANGIPAGTVLRSRLQALSAEGPAQLASTTVGGRERRSQKEMVQQYRSAVLARGRLVTRRDIMEHCRMVCGSRLKTVAVVDGVMVAPDPLKGLVRCLDVQLTFEERIPAADTAHLRERLRTELNSASALSLPLHLT